MAENQEQAFQEQLQMCIRDRLKLLEGAEVEVPVGATSKNAMVPLTTINTRNILFICGGAFPNLEGIIKKRLMKKTSIGFGADLKDRFDEEANIIAQVTNCLLYTSRCV